MGRMMCVCVKGALVALGSSDVPVFGEFEVDRELHGFDLVSCKLILQYSSQSHFWQKNSHTALSQAQQTAWLRLH